jgi:hypothetical protein
MGSVKNGFGPKAPKFFAFDVKYDSGHMPDARPTNDRIRPALSPRVPSKLRSNSHIPVAGSAAETAGSARVRKTRNRTRRDTNANRAHGGGGMYWSPDEGMGQ